MKTTVLLTTLISLGMAAACGGDGDSGGAAAPTGSYEAVASAIEAPTGTVDETTVGDVGEEFGKATSAGVGGERQVKQSQSQEMACAAGGKLSYTASGTQENVQVNFVYDGCCQEASCCFDGGGTVYQASAAGAAYSTCANYDITAECEGQSLAINYSACVGTDGVQTYAIVVNGSTYAVSGTYYNGSGTLTIRGENGTWECTYTDGSGSCTGTGGDFSFE